MFLQVLYACKEYAATAVDIIARRTRLAFLNANATAECLPRIVELMSAELGWDKDKERVRLCLDMSATRGRNRN